MGDTFAQMWRSFLALFWAAMRPEIKKGAALRSGKRRRDLDQIVLHESVTSSRRATERVLKKRRLSVHFMVDRDGSITQHAPVSRATYHAGSGHNSRSVGLEMVSPYYGSRAKKGDEVIKARWAHKKRYILPSAEQAEASFKVIRWLCCLHDIPFQFSCVDEDALKFKWGRDKEGASRPGILAHHRFHHADALFFEHYAAARHLSGLDEADAYECTKSAASSGKRVTTLPRRESS